MIKSFTLKNFKSIKDEMTINFTKWYPGKRDSSGTDDDCLRTTAIFGANASGKSNYIKGLKFLKRLITDPYYKSKDPIYNWDSDDDKTTFEICFTIDKNDGFEDYDYRIVIRSVGNRNEKLMKQIFTFEVVSEDLVVTDSSNVEKRITRKGSGSIGDTNLLLQEIESLKEKLDLTQSKMMESQKEVDYKQKELATLGMDIDIERVQVIKAEEDFEKRKTLLRQQDIHSYSQDLLGELLDGIKVLREKLSCKKTERQVLSKKMHELKGIESDERDECILKMMVVEKEINYLYETLSQRESNYELLKEAVVHQDEIKSHEKRLENLIRKREGVEKEIELLNVNQSRSAQKIDLIYKQIDETREKLEKAVESQSGARPYISTKDQNCFESHLETSEDLRLIGNVYRWFVSTLVILETDDFYFPLNQPNLLDNVSKILMSLDVGIYGLAWVKSDFEKGSELPYFDYTRMDLIKNQISENDRRKIKDCERNSVDSSALSSVIIKTGPELNLFTYWKGEETVKKLVAYHDINRKAATNITSESDGTRRLIELASILLPSDNERVFIIDELERRLHPLLTQRFIELFLQDEKRNKQLIFTTHEFRLMSKELFCPEEIWYMNKEGGTSYAVPLDVLIEQNPKLLRKRTDKLYLDYGALPGIPHIGALPKNVDYTVR